MMTPAQVLALPLPRNDSGADTVGGYLRALLSTLWNEEESFSGKRPFGNSGWRSDVVDAVIDAGASEEEVDQLILNAIATMGAP